MSITAILSSEPFALALPPLKLTALAAPVLWAVVRLAGSREDPQTARDPQPKG